MNIYKKNKNHGVVEDISEEAEATSSPEQECKDVGELVEQHLPQGSLLWGSDEVQTKSRIGRIGYCNHSGLCIVCWGVV